MAPDREARPAMSDQQPPPPPQSPQPTGPSHPAAGGSAPRSRRGVVVAAVVALVLVVGVVGFLLGRALGGEPSDRAESNAHAACVILERTDADDPLPQDGLDDPTFWELSAVPGLTGAAAAGDGEYDDLDEQGQVVGTAVQTLSRERLSEAVRAATEECESLGLG